MDTNTLIDVAAEAVGSIKELAKRLGTHRNRLGEWKKGRGEPDAYETAVMAQLAKLPILQTIIDVQLARHPDQWRTWTQAQKELGRTGADSAGR
jgi:hypothetical protein